MMPALLLKTITSIKKEVLIVLGVIVILLMLPVIALASVTDLGALADTSVRLYTGPASKTNTYDYGYCTFWAAKRREEVGKAIPSNWGNANTWDDRSLSAGYVASHIPVQFAIMQTDAGALGHVAFVESVGPDGSWTISEMNFKGWDIVNNRTFKASDAKNFNFIH